MESLSIYRDKKINREFVRVMVDDKKLINIFEMNAKQTPLSREEIYNYSEHSVFFHAFLENQLIGFLVLHDSCKVAFNSRVKFFVDEGLICDIMPLIKEQINNIVQTLFIESDKKTIWFLSNDWQWNGYCEEMHIKDDLKYVFFERENILQQKNR